MYLNRVKKQLIELKLASPDELLGCTEDEVVELEEKLGILLPKAYQEFLLFMGHGAGRFLRGSDYFFKDLLVLKHWALALLEENNFPESLPEDAFVFLMHQGYQFSFFRVSQGDNPPTYYYCEGTDETAFIKSHDKYSDFLMTEVEIHANYLYSGISL